ncbi:DUF1838 family protein [Niveispirillum cyanobacteriorum]|uniref:DUF1838 domain-containing protein n=1 Tax=Niveispirillum cyanobacteriorum TaxID=1612173 RepID=A0A2K9N7A9_9PROT|nr:DUF1838 family protein [Niveispirillum cyanobacteriorum]AUN28862.1 hypothetical protein C0V82_00280 [Niveispirillum cyanobacteriorum]
MIQEAMFKSLSRRSIFSGMAGMGAMAASVPAFGAPPLTKGNLRPLDVMDPKENLYGFGKMWGTLGSKAVLSGYQGVQYAIVGDKRAVPLFGYCGFGNNRNIVQPDGSLKVLGKECGYFTDLATGEIIDHWDNPWTGERVEVFPFLNDRWRGTLTLEQKVFRVGDSETVNNDNGTKGQKGKPFLLPWQRIGDQYLLSWDYAHEYTNPVTPEGWPKASTGKRVNPSEHFTIFTPAAEIDDRSLPSARFTAGFMRQAPWWPWMRMGQSGVHGVLMGRMHSYKITGTVEDIPKAVLKRVERERPDLLEEPTDGPDEGVRGTLEAYAEDVPPEVPGYVSPMAEKRKQMLKEQGK